ncbi:dynein axonemal assembly factor 11-like [Pocillopora verrucosa]|uniref:dynein axonemal assembly factor 11-like n=1 Tax=Pocillopora verrucosa TaxID=203993 RepID=UPI00333F9451
MVRITEDLLRKRAEHNNCEIFSLEEISLHQQEIERIELLDKLCRDLKILYLQSNLIPKIENVSRLKKLEYLNLALNNVTRVENLEGCESLKKLDLTVNFIGELTSVESLRGNYHFRELYLTGNPCTEYEGYREYVIATLDSLKWLDGKEIDKSERILAKQDYENIRNKIVSQQSDHAKKREREKQEAAKTKTAEKELQSGNENQNECISESSEENQRKTEKEEEEEEKRFWQEKTDFTPESRIELHQHIEEKRKQREKIDDERIGRNKPAKETRFFASDGHVLNINQGKWDFQFDDDEDNNRFVLDLPCFKHLDTSLIDVDVQPTYVRVTVKGKVFQLALSEEVNPDSSSAKRSQTTGHLIISMPKVRQVVKPLKKTSPTKIDPSPSGQKQEAQPSSEPSKHSRIHHERLEVEPNINSDMDFSKIANNSQDKTKQRDSGRVSTISESKEESFVDDPDVPPLI